MNLDDNNRGRVKCHICRVLYIDLLTLLLGPSSYLYDWYV